MTFGFEPICINSALVSAQNRQRLYWVGIRQADGTYKKTNIEQPKDRGILLKDILETNSVTWLNKARTIDATYYKGGSFNGHRVHQNADRLMAADPVPARLVGRNPDNPSDRRSGINLEQRYEVKTDGKSYTLTTVTKDNLVAEPIGINVTIDGKSQTLKAQYMKNSVANFVGYTSTYGATGVAEPVRVGTMPSPNGELRGGKP